MGEFTYERDKKHKQKHTKRVEKPPSNHPFILKCFMKPGLGFEKEMLSWLSLVRKFGTCCLSLSRALFGYFSRYYWKFLRMNLQNRSNVLRSFSSVAEITAYLFGKFCLGFNILNFDRKFSQSSPLFKEYFAYFFHTNTESVNRSWYLCTLHLLEFTTLNASIFHLRVGKTQKCIFSPPSVLLLLSSMSFTIMPSNPHVHVFKPPSYQ